MPTPIGFSHAASTFGAAQQRIEIQPDFLTAVVDNLEVGIGTLVDADMTEKSARLPALQVQQQLATQSLAGSIDADGEPSPCYKRGTDFAMQLGLFILHQTPPHNP